MVWLHMTCFKELLLRYSKYFTSSQSTGLHMTYEDNKEWINESVTDWVRSGVSVVARDPDTGKIGGTLLATILTREQANTYQQALTSPKTKVDVPKIKLGVQVAMKHFMCGCRNEEESASDSPSTFIHFYILSHWSLGILWSLLVC